MKIVNLACPICLNEKAHTPITKELRFKNDCLYELDCPKGHHFKASILYHEFQKLFEIGISSLVDDYYREALGSFAASHERFSEIFIRVVLRSNGVEADLEQEGWKEINNRSERQLGAFVVLYVSEFIEMPKILSNPLVKLRNKVVHQGYFPSKEECVKYGSEVLACIRSGIARLYNSKKHHDALINSINDQGNFGEAGVQMHFFAYTLIGTNRPPEQDTKSFEQMLEEATQARASRLPS